LNASATNALAAAQARWSGDWGRLRAVARYRGQRLGRAFRERIVVPVDHALVMSPKLGVETAGLVEPLAVAWHAATIVGQADSADRRRGPIARNDRCDRCSG
jgi:hypothetical protein